MEERIFYPGQILRDARIAKGVSVEGLARTGHIKPSSLEMYESGEMYLKYGIRIVKSTLRLMTDRLGIPLEKLFEKGLTDEPEPSKSEAVLALIRKVIDHFYDTPSQQT